MKKEKKPSYYQKFRCSADQCSFTCCKEWKIAVDEDTYQLWKDIKLEHEEKYLNQFTRIKDEERIIKLDHQQKCPFLCENQLCQIVVEKGEVALSKTCHTFPRQIHEFQNQIEYSLVSCCPEVVDLLYKGELCKEELKVEQTQKTEFLWVRNLLMDIIENKELSTRLSLKMCFFILLSILEEMQENPKASFQYGQEERAELGEALRELPIHEWNTIQERNELFLDLSQNYRKQGIYREILEPLGELAEEIEAGLCQGYENFIQPFQMEMEQYERLFQSFLINELYTNGLLPNADLDSLVMMVQWIAMEYVTIRHILFLQYVKTPNKPISYETVRDSVVLIARMTGYDQEDIYEYMQESFQKVIWEWGYFELLV